MNEAPWRYKEGEFDVTRTCVWSPPGCHPVGCGAKLYTDKDGKLVKVEGDENNPVSQGRLCVRCLAHTQYMYHPDRIVHPMKRAREDRGKDKWEQITWDEAYDIIEQKVKEAKATYGPESVVLFGGTGREGGPLVVWQAQRVLGVPNACYTQSGYSCYVPRVAGSFMAMGTPYPEIDNAGGFADRYDDPRFELPGVIVLWGKEPMPSNGDGFYGYSVLDMMKRGSKVITVDPRLNWVASRSLYHLQLRPGTDAAMALGWMNVIINEDLYDHDFVEKWTYGFDQIKERVQEYPPSKVAEICGVPEEYIIGAARAYATAKSASIAWGLALDQNPNGMQAGHAVLSLEALTGNIDVPGGQILGPFGKTDDTQMKQGSGNEYEIEMAPPETQAKIIGLQEYPFYVALSHNSHADLMLECLETDEPYKMQVGGIMSTNIIAGTNSAEPKRWHDALQRIPFVFASDLFITPTIQCCADVFLPLTTMAEHDTVVATHYGSSPVTTGANNQACDAGDCKCDLEIMYDLGKRIMPQNFRLYDDWHSFMEDYYLGGSESSKAEGTQTQDENFIDRVLSEWSASTTVLDDFAEDDDHMYWSELQRRVVVQRPTTYRKYETGDLRGDGQPGFNTPTGRFEFWCTTYPQYGEDAMPYFIEPEFQKVNSPELAEKYPLVLTTGSRVHQFFHSENRQQDYCREQNPYPLMEINPVDAEARGIKDGDWVHAYNDFGECLMKADVRPVVTEGVVHGQHGWWFPEEDKEEPHLYGVFRSNVNCLIPNGHHGKLGFGSPYKCMVCQVEKATDKDFERLGEVKPWHATVC